MNNKQGVRFLFKTGGEGVDEMRFLTICLYILKNIIRVSEATEREDLCIFDSLNAAPLGSPEPKSVL